MLLRFLVSALLLSLVLLSCGNNPASNNVVINISLPTSSTIWQTGQINTDVTWTPISGETVSIEIWYEGLLLDVYKDCTTNDGQFERVEGIPENWGTGTDFSIKVIDEDGNYGFSESFSIDSSPLPTGMEFVTVYSGSFEMGAPEEEQGSNVNERPVHTVTFDYSFQIMSTEVTQQMWEEVMGTNPAHFDGNTNPIEMVTWYDCQDFVEAMNLLDSNHTYRLPSESEWEYCCRAGTTTRYYWGDDLDETLIDDYAWWTNNADGSTHPVGLKLPNAWGLYDMNGNVWEWCEDWHNSDYVGAPSDGSPWLSGNENKRVYRGSSWVGFAKACRSAYRHFIQPDQSYFGLGLRLVRE